MEILQLFDAQKRPVKGKGVPRTEKWEMPEGLRFMIVLVFIRDIQGRFLLQKTSVSKGSVYAATGGHVSLGDSSVSAILREAKEELSLDLDPGCLKYAGCVQRPKNWCDVYYTEQPVESGKLKLQEEEVAGIGWYTVEEILRMDQQGTLRVTNRLPFQVVEGYLRTGEVQKIIVPSE